MTILRNLAVTAAVIAGSTALFASSANASGILNRLADLQDQRGSRENQVTNPLIRQDRSLEGVEMAGEPSAVSTRVDDGTPNSAIFDRLHDLRSTSPRQGIVY
ncbi:MAG: hypothetical protein AB4050_07350 [Synechococcus sp.]